jgi:hypothetical protein
MAKATSTRKIVTSSKPAAKPATVAQAVAATDAAIAKLAAKAAPAADATPAKPAPTTAVLLAAADAIATPAVAKPSAKITRTAATVAAQATNFAVLSDRDTAYLAFYSKLVKRADGARITLADIAGSGERPNYAGSNKPHDAGVIVRLTKAGLLQTATDGHGFTVSERGRTHAAYTSATV